MIHLISTSGFVSRYHAATERLQHLAPPSDKFVHVQVGLLIWISAALVTRRALRTPLPLAIVFGAEVFNEVMDRLYLGNWNWPDTSGDALATWFWPTALFLLLRTDKRMRA